VRRHWDEAEAALLVFRADWLRLARVQLTEPLLARVDALAWDYALRGYDAAHLASALYWQESLREPVTLATFGRELWRAAAAAGLAYGRPTCRDVRPRRARSETFAHPGAT
jgi:hypothetical protein